MTTHGKPTNGLKHSLDHAIGTAALETLAKMKPEEFVASLKKQGIGSLEDLAARSVETARSAVQAGNLAFDPEVFGVCYKFSAYRPHFGTTVINQVVNIVKQEIAG